MRCTETKDLIVTHIKPDGPRADKIGNARVLCKVCLEEDEMWGHLPEEGLPVFNDITKRVAMQRAGNRCECIRLGG